MTVTGRRAAANRAEWHRHVHRLWLYVGGVTIATAFVGVLIKVPELFVGTIILLTAVVVVTGLGIAVVLPPPPPLATRSALAEQFAWLWRFMVGATLVGVSAFVAVGAQAEFDGASTGGAAGQLDALAQACFGLLGDVFLIGLTVMGVRIAWVMMRSGWTARFRAAAALLGLLGLHGRSRTVLAAFIVKITNPGPAALFFYLAPSVFWAATQTMLVNAR